MQCCYRRGCVAVIAGLFLGLSGCQQERNNAGAAGGARDTPSAAPFAAGTAQPAPMPPGDPSLPPPGTQSSDATSIDTVHSALTKGESDKALPLEGQTNSYSSDAFAKRGNEAIPRGTSAGPRGDETVSTPNSYPKEPK